MVTDRRQNRMREVLRNRQHNLTVVCENIHDPHNVSAILRSCDSVGIPNVHLLYTSEKFPELGKKSSASAKKWVEIVRERDYHSLRERLKSRGMSIFATQVKAEAKSIYELDWTRPSAIVVGNEHRGVSDEMLSIADQAIYIPMFGMVESLNVSVATAIILYEALRQRMKAGLYPAADEFTYEQTLNDWLEREQNRKRADKS